jgi:hypothetical protein
MGSRLDIRTKTREVDMFGRRSTAVATAAALIAGFAALSVAAANADGERGAQPAAEQINKLKESMSLQTVDSVGQAQRLAAAAGLRGQTITFITHVIPGRDVFVDVPPADSSPGDIFVQEASVFDGSHTKVIGEAILRCELQVTTIICDHSVSLNGRGKLLLSRPFIGNEMGAITGGTGDFKNAGGQGTWFDLGEPDFDMLFVVELVR